RPTLALQNQAFPLKPNTFFDETNPPISPSSTGYRLLNTDYSPPSTFPERCIVSPCTPPPHSPPSPPSPPPTPQSQNDYARKPPRGHSHTPATSPRYETNPNTP